MHVAYPQTVYMDDNLLRILTPTLTLLMTFRTNRAFERYWSGSQMWTSLCMCIRNASRLLWTVVSCGTDAERDEQLDAQRLLLAVAVSMKWALRGEDGFEHPDVIQLLPTNHHLWKLASRPAPSSSDPTSPSLRMKRGNVVTVPLDIAYRISHYTRRLRHQNLIHDTEDIPQLNSAISAMIDSITKFESIVNISVPPSYDMHLKQLLWLYLFFLPLQIVRPMKEMSVLTACLVSFAFLGLDAIANEIEEPFGTDTNDLPLDYLTRKLQEDIESNIEQSLTSHRRESSITMPVPTIHLGVPKKDI
ncbi:hypothetical protein SmJEL517_g01925 [Synchytrium microbalum]|uniref:Bestrophin homolog n=1 Tax=Synchytrium microbalum TaxID=1806994 RepID=A0A507CCN0_9FUNG|nr:uncharacterized protein SmJEL517_g01925 [Synchytrium microbalum]TPX35674.1 hypothetical protein SmJEL517_g01925 [Synchytrium microbalum]